MKSQSSVETVTTHPATGTLGPVCAKVVPHFMTGRSTRDARHHRRDFLGGRLQGRRQSAGDILVVPGPFPFVRYLLGRL